MCANQDCNIYIYIVYSIYYIYIYTIYIYKIHSYKKIRRYTPDHKFSISSFLTLYIYIYIYIYIYYIYIYIIYIHTCWVGGWLCVCACARKAMYATREIEMTSMPTEREIDIFDEKNYSYIWKVCNQLETRYALPVRQ